MTEKDFYQLAKRHMPHWTWDRVESTINSGQPDCIISHGYHCHRLELKLIKHGALWFEPSQISWANRMSQGYVWNIWVLAYDTTKQQPHLIPYRRIPKLATSEPKRKQYRVKTFDIALSHSDWPAINRALRFNEEVTC